LYFSYRIYNGSLKFFFFIYTIKKSRRKYNTVNLLKKKVKYLSVLQCVCTVFIIENATVASENPMLMYWIVDLNAVSFKAKYCTLTMFINYSSNDMPLLIENLCHRVGAVLPILRPQTKVFYWKRHFVWWIIYKHHHHCTVVTLWIYFTG
jgi:hypothetical protein